MKKESIILLILLLYGLNCQPSPLKRDKYKLNELRELLYVLRPPQFPKLEIRYSGACNYSLERNLC